MTRINVIPVYELTDEHLKAEYRELPMVPQALRRTIGSKSGLDLNKIKPHYTLNKGHVTFFYDKLAYLERRYVELVFEMKKRGFNPDPKRDNKLKGLPRELYNNYLPDRRAREVNMERIVERINSKPDYYKFFGKPLKTMLKHPQLKAYRGIYE